jgi:hypothetical protein
MIDVIHYLRLHNREPRPAPVVVDWAAQGSVHDPADVVGEGTGHVHSCHKRSKAHLECSCFFQNTAHVYIDEDTYTHATSTLRLIMSAEHSCFFLTLHVYTKMKTRSLMPQALSHRAQ